METIKGEKMSNLELLKAELLRQKTALENIGVTVNVANNNPSPSEITTAIKSITKPNYTQITTTAEDVRADKTFVDSNGLIKQGTMAINKYETYFTNYMNGVNLAPLCFPPGVTHLRSYSFNEQNFKNPALIGEVVIPGTIKSMGKYCFYYCRNLTKLTFEEGFQSFEDLSIVQCNSLQEVVLPHSVITLGSAFLNGCKVKVLDLSNTSVTQITYCPISGSTVLEEVYLPKGLTLLNALVNSTTSPLYRVQFYNKIAPNITNATKYHMSSAPICYYIVPAESIESYLNNRLILANLVGVRGFIDVNAGDVFPVLNPKYSYTWYPSFDDMKNETNSFSIKNEDGSIKTCSTTGTYYVDFENIEEETTDDNSTDSGTETDTNS